MMLLRIAAVAAALSSPLQAQIAPPVPEATIPSARVDNTLEVTGEALLAETRRTRLLIDVLVNDKGPYRFLVDSGADRSVVGAALADRLDLPKRDIAMLQSMAGRSPVNTVFVDTLTLGRSEIAGLKLPALPERFLGADGLIGIDALADQRLLLDFENKTVIVQDSRQSLAREPGEIVVTARRRKGQLILTEVRVAGVGNVFAVIDTGSDITVGNLALQRELLRNRGRPPVAPIELISVTGETVTANLMSVPEIRVGGIVMRNVPMAFVDASPFTLFGLGKQPAMLLGTDLLNNFRRVALDFSQRKVRFTLRRGPR